MKSRTLTHRGFTLVELLVVITIIALLAGIATPLIMKGQKNGYKIKATANLKSVGQFLREFDNEYNNCPDNASAPEVTNRTGSSVGPLSGNASNDYLRQLIAAGLLKDERIFYCRAPFTKNPDNDVSGNKALDKGEVGFGYIMNNQGEGQSMSGDGRRPILVSGLLLTGGGAAPADGGGGLKTGELGGGGAAGGVRDITGDIDVFNGVAPILLLDGSVMEGKVREDKKIIMPEGGNRGLLETGDKTVWGTDITPVLVKPRAK